jgi:acetolactate synthase-1/2/3 large subunit
VALLARARQAEGVQRVFAVPGEENPHLLEAPRETPIELIIARHEQSVGFMAAATEGRLTDGARQ